MAQSNIRKIPLHELKDIYKRIQADFAFGEYPPYDVLHMHLEKGIQEGLIFYRDEQACAYAVCAAHDEKDFVLVSLFAVFQEFRGQGIGTAFLGELCDTYSARQGIIVEVEKPEDAQNNEERQKRLKRIEFYKRAGFCMIPGVDYSIWDIPMHLMVLSDKVAASGINECIGEVMYDIYLKLMGHKYIHKMKFKKI